MDGDVTSGTEQNSKASGVSMSAGEVLLEFLSILTKHRRFIVRLVFVITFIAGLTAILSPKWYKSSAVVFPVEQTSLFQGLENISSLAKNLTGGKLPGLGTNNEIDRYMAILKSESVLLKVIDRFDLTPVD